MLVLFLTKLMHPIMHVLLLMMAINVSVTNTTRLPKSIACSQEAKEKLLATVARFSADGFAV